jgi:hypothetical protein
MNAKNIITKILGEKPKNVDWILKDSDKDGVMNGLDCEPENPKEQGIIHKTANFLRGKGFQDVEYQKKQVEKAEEKALKEQKELTQKKKEFSEFKKEVQKQEEYEKREEAQAKKTLGPVGRTVYKGYDVLRDVGQATVRGTKEMTTYKGATDVYDYEKSAGYKLAKEEAEKEGLRGVVGKVTKTGIDVGEGVIRAVPGGAPTLQYSKENLKERPGVAGGQIIGELATWQVAGAGLSKTIGSTGKLSRISKDTSKSLAARSAAKAGELAATGTQKIVTSKPVRYASEGWTGEAVDITQAYLGQRGEISKSLQEGNLKEAGARLAAGYVVEKAGDKAVGTGFRKAMPQTDVTKKPFEIKNGKIVERKATPDVEKFISESGSDPKIARLFEVRPVKETTAQKFERYTGIDFKKPDTRIDPRVLAGTKPLKGGEWEYKGIKLKTDAEIKGFKGTKLEKLERQEKIEKLEKLEKLEKQERVVKTKIIEPFFLPIGSAPMGFKPFSFGPFIGGKTYTAKVKDLSKFSGTGPKKPIITLKNKWI